MNYRRTQRDANQAEVSAHLKRIGYEVLDMAAVGVVPDILVHKNGHTVWVEIKIPGSRAKWHRRQLQFIASTRFNVIVARSGDEAADKLRERKYLSQADKDRLSALLAVDGRAYFQPSEIETLIQG